MSIDLNYHVFDPRKADKAYDRAVSDLATIVQRVNFLDVQDRSSAQEENTQNWNELYEEVRKKYAKGEAELLQKAISQLKSDEYMIPWIEWDRATGVDKRGFPLEMTVTEKANYTFGSIDPESYPELGLLYKRGSDVLAYGNQYGKEYVSFPKEFPEITKEYHDIERAEQKETEKINNQRDNIELDEDRKFDKAFEKTFENLTEAQLRLVDNELYWPFMNLTEKEEDVVKSIFGDLDLHLGTTASAYIESPDCIEEMEAIIRDITATNDEKPFKEALTKFFTSLTAAQYHQLIERISNAMEWSKEEASAVVKAYLRATRPLAKLIIEDPTLELISTINDEASFEYFKSGTISTFEQRQEAHMEAYKGKFKGIR